jgi:hypothetical protein
VTIRCSAGLVIVYLERSSATVQSMPVEHLRGTPGVAASPAFERWWWFQH